MDDALEEIAEQFDGKPNNGSRTRKRGAGKVFYAALHAAHKNPLAKLKRAQAAYLTVKLKREGKQ